MRKTITLLFCLFMTGLSFNLSAQNPIACKDFHQIILECAQDFKNSKKNLVNTEKGNSTYETSLPSLGLNAHIKNELTYNLITEVDELKYRYYSTKVYQENESEAQKIFDHIVQSISSCFSSTPINTTFMGIKTSLFEVEYQNYPVIMDISILHLSKDKKSVVTISIKKKD